MKIKQITPKQFLKSMKVLAEKFSDDPEAFHGSADELIGLVMKQQGFEEGMEVFWKNERWYA